MNLTFAQNRLLPVSLFFLALAVRLALFAATFPGSESVKFYEDVTIANHLIEGDGYSMAYSGLRMTDHLLGLPPGIEMDEIESRPTAIKPPTYPLIVALVFRLFGARNFLALLIVQAVLAAATCALLYSVARAAGPLVGVMSASLFALYPPFAYHSIHSPESTTTQLFLICLFLFLMLRHRNARSTGLLVATGLVGAAIALHEVVAIPLVGLGLVYICLLPIDSEAKREEWSLRRRSRGLSLALAFLILALAPWIYRNHQVFDSFPLLRTGIGASLLLTLRQAEVLPDEVVIDIAKRVPGTNELQEDLVIKDEVMAWIKEHPAAYARIIPRNFVEYWWETARYRGNRSPKYLLGRKIPYILLLSLSLPALLWRCIELLRRPVQSLRTNVLSNLALILIVSYTGVYMVFGAFNIRYHFPVELMLMIFAGQTLSYLLDRIRAAPENTRLTHPLPG